MISFELLREQAPSYGETDHGMRLQLDHRIMRRRKGE